MSANVGFWDTSAIIPLYCNQSVSPRARQLRRQFNKPVVWWGTGVEIHSGLHRLFQEGQMNDVQLRKSLDHWNRLRRRARVVRPDDDVLRVAVSLPAKHNIRAMDAFQLAAAIIWCGERPRNRSFITVDHRLGLAARDAGFNVVDLQ